MERRRLGKTDMEVSVLGFGGSEIGYQRVSRRTVDLERRFCALRPRPARHRTEARRHPTTILREPIGRLRGP